MKLGVAAADRIWRSLQIEVTRKRKGGWSVAAPWLAHPIEADTWEAAYHEAMGATVERAS